MFFSFCCSPPPHHSIPLSCTHPCLTGLGLAAVAMRRQKKVIEWLEDLAIIGPFQTHDDFVPVERTLAALAQLGAEGGTVESMDPDTGLRLRGSAVVNVHDREEEEHLLYILWQHVRAGRLEEAADVCRHYKQHWRAATFGGAQRSVQVNEERG